VAVLTGSGEAHIRRRAAELGVDDRLQILPGAPPEQLGKLLDEVDVCLSTQTTNLAGHVRTTGKLVEYLALGKVVVASRAGTAAAVLPPFLTVDRDDVFSAGYVQAVASRIEALTRMGDDDFVELQRYNHALALRLFSPVALAPVWLAKMGEWGVLPLTASPTAHLPAGVKR
jgi:glycosyltransferase involved in cell wall biosynthesis